MKKCNYKNKKSKDKDYICNPKTGRWVKIDGKTGKEIIKKQKKKNLNILSQIKSVKLKSSSSKKESSLKTCTICFEEIEKKDQKILSKCGHTFHKDCIDTAFKYNKKCPTCGTLYGITDGNQPNGKMTKTILNTSLAGHKGSKTIQININFPSGTQNSSHPNPGKKYSSDYRTFYLPDTQEGNEVLKLIEKAFKHKLLFTIGTSLTTGKSNVVVFNGIHLKTSFTGTYGYPDKTYFKRVKEELKLKGIE